MYFKYSKVPGPSQGSQARSEDITIFRTAARGIIGYQLLGNRPRLPRCLFGVDFEVNLSEGGREAMWHGRATKSAREQS